MIHRAYTLGYQGQKPEALLAAVSGIGAVLCDIRYAPYSRQPGWSKKPLQALFGTTYQHIPQLGNVNYKSGGSIAIADMDAGLKIVLDLLEHRPVVLMCVCRRYKTCHRRDIAVALRQFEADIEELEL
jgi:uncharacterized protein (DUF488 family)